MCGHVRVLGARLCTQTRHAGPSLADTSRSSADGLAFRRPKTGRRAVRFSCPNLGDSQRVDKLAVKNIFGTENARVPEPYA